ncbi:hypothetical protein ACFL60_07440 [Candidatus Omnitrophota bacterium]
MEELRLELTTELKENETKLAPRLDKRESIVYNLLSSDPIYIDELSEEAKMDISDVSGILLNLEMKKFARQLPGKNFVRE